MVAVEDDIRAAGAEIIWVLEMGAGFTPGTAEECLDFMTEIGSAAGWCVGDDETEPEADVWDESPFSVGRGFDIITPRETMEIVYTTSHGTPSGNENPDGTVILEEVQAVVDGL